MLNQIIKNKNKGIGFRYYSSQEVTSNNVDSVSQIVDIKPEKCYDDAYTLKSLILNCLTQPGVFTQGLVITNSST